MDYSYCSKMFTEGQKARMHAALNSNAGGRNNVWSNSNLIATGVNDPDVLCKADFRSNIQTVCTGSQVQFTDDSFNNVTGWTWTFDGGTPATSTSQNPTVTYNSPGTYSVTLEATDGSSSETEVKSGYITVLPDGDPLPYSEDFENISSLNAPDWEVINIDGDASFQVYNGVSASGGNKSVRLYNYGNPTGRVDELISGNIDLLNVSPITMTFKYAYKKRNNGNNESLQVYFSKDCGETWSIRKNISGNSLSSETQSTAYTPLEGDWQTVVIDDISFTTFEVQNFKFKLVFESDEGNNIYIDDINIFSGSASTEDFEKVSALSIYPNPTSDKTNIQLNMVNNDELTITVKDYLGRTIYVDNKGQQTKGVKQYELPSASWANGMYMVNIKVGDNVLTKKLIKK